MSPKACQDTQNLWSNVAYVPHTHIPLIKAKDMAKSKISRKENYSLLAVKSLQTKSERNGGHRISASQQTFVTVTFTPAYAQSLQKSYPVTISGLTSRLPCLHIRSCCSFSSLGAQCTEITSSLPSTPDGQSRTET